MNKVKLETLTLSQVLEGSVYGQWDNPHNLAVPTPQKAQAFRANPLSKDHGLPSQVVATLDGVIIGNMDMFEGEISVSGEKRSILWGSNLFVHPDYRHVAAGLGLLMQMQRSHPIVGVVGVSKMVHGVYQGLKWKEVVMPRIVAVSKSRAVLRSLVKYSALAAAASVAVDLGCWLNQFLMYCRHRGAFQQFEVTVVEAVPEDLIDVLNANRPSFSPDRSVARLKWLHENTFDANPSRKKVMQVVRSKQGSCVGFVLVKQRHYDVATQREIKDIDLASVVDWGVLPGSGLSENAIVVRGVLAAMGMGAHVVEVPTASYALQRALKRQGFRQVGELSAFFKAAKGHEFDIDEASASALRGSDGDNYFA